MIITLFGELGGQLDHNSSVLTLSAPLDTKSSSTVPTSSSCTGCTKLVTLSEGVKQVWPASAIDRLVREFPEVGGNVSSIWLVRELYLEPGAGAVSAIARLVREALGVETGDALASIDWLTREALGDTTGDALAIAWLVREFLGDRGELLRF